MNVQREDHDRGVVFLVDGQVDMHTSPELRRHLRQVLEAKNSPVVIDLSSVSFIDSSGLATLIEALQGVGRYGGKLRLVGLAPAVKNLFRLSNLTSIFDIRDSREEALEG
ncbi:MAG: STAS domain-containing protein [Planctomycetota bacterium]